MTKLRAVLPTLIKRVVWDVEYGLLGYPHLVAPDDIVRYLSPRLPRISMVLDLGCGRGSLLRALREKGWTGDYCGVDISSRSIDDARKVADRRSTWVVSDIESFRSTSQWNVIAMVESIYYMKVSALPAFLERLIGMLSPTGVLVFRVHDLEKHQEHLEMILGFYPSTQKVGQNLFCISRAPHLN